MKPKAHPKYRFPWRSGNRFELLVDGEGFFPRMLATIEEAHQYILLELYLFESGAVANRFIEALGRAAQRGVTVNLLLDDFGAYGLSKHDRLQLARGQIQLAFYNRLRHGKLLRNLFRDHRKLLFIDGETAFVGGFGISDYFDSPEHPGRRWRETVIRIQGPVLADWQTLFLQVWNRNAPQPLALPTPTARPCDKGKLGRVVATGGLKVQEIKRSLIKHVRSAEHRVWIATAYFIASRKIQRALRYAAKQGADVRLLLPGPYTDHPAIRHAGRRFYSRLLRHGVRIFEYQPRFLHAKVILCDHWVSLGSSNLDRWNLRWNLEANQEVDDQGFAEAVRALFEEDFSHSIEYHYEQWLRRPWYVRLAERLWGAVDLWLARLGQGRDLR